MREGLFFDLVEVGCAAAPGVEDMTALDRVGFFDPRYFMSGEDVDLCYRLKLGGWKIFYLPTAGASHHLRPASPEAERKMSYERHRSMWVYHFKHHAEDVSAFGNGLVWAQIWGRYAAGRLRDTFKGKRPKRESG